jgi:ribosomal-protein-alanine N-acetyltransferase
LELDLVHSTDPEASAYVLLACTEADLDDVMEIERLSFPAPWERQAFADELSRPWARLQLLRHTATGHAVAFTNWWLVADELHILNIAVHPDHRRQGLASLVLRQVLDEARAQKAITVSLEVRVSNHAAQTLYRSFGFRQVGLRPRYYANNGEDAVLMDLDLSR